MGDPGDGYGAGEAACGGVVTLPARPGFLTYRRHSLPAFVLAQLDAETEAIGGVVDRERGLYYVPARPPQRRRPIRRLRGDR